MSPSLRLHTQNLREAIASYRSRFLKEMRERQRNALLSIALVSQHRTGELVRFGGSVLLSIALVGQCWSASLWWVSVPPWVQ